jgi:hypothetical protein
MLLAAPLVNTTGGAIQLVYGPVILTAILAAWAGVKKRLDKQDSNNATQDVAIGVIVSQIAPLTTRMGTAEVTITSMGQAQAVLQEQVRAHLEWAAARDKALTKKNHGRPQGYPQAGTQGQ